MSKNSDLFESPLRKPKTATPIGNRPHDRNRRRPVKFDTLADELRQQEFARLAAAVTPRLEALRSMTPRASR